MNNEPIWTVAGASAFVASVIALLVAFGVEVSQEQTAAIMAVVNVVAISAVAYFSRKKVTPNSKVAEVIREDGVRVAGEASPLPTGTVLDPGVEQVPAH